MIIITATLFGSSGRRIREPWIITYHLGKDDSFTEIVQKMAQGRVEMWPGSTLEGIRASLLWPLSGRIMGFTGVN